MTYWPAHFAQSVLVLQDRCLVAADPQVRRQRHDLRQPLHGTGVQFKHPHPNLSRRDNSERWLVSRGTCPVLATLFGLSLERFEALNPAFNCTADAPPIKKDTSMCMGGTCGD